MYETAASSESNSLNVDCDVGRTRRMRCMAGSEWYEVWQHSNGTMDEEREIDCIQRIDNFTFMVGEFDRGHSSMSLLITASMLRKRVWVMATFVDEVCSRTPSVDSKCAFEACFSKYVVKVCLFDAKSGFLTVCYRSIFSNSIGSIAMSRPCWK